MSVPREWSGFGARRPGRVLGSIPIPVRWERLIRELIPRRQPAVAVKLKIRRQDAAEERILGCLSLGTRSLRDPSGTGHRKKKKPRPPSLRSCDPVQRTGRGVYGDSCRAKCDITGSRC
jgi:hypothetical protein